MDHLLDSSRETFGGNGRKMVSGVTLTLQRSRWGVYAVLCLYGHYFLKYFVVRYLSVSMCEIYVRETRASAAFLELGFHMRHGGLKYCSSRVFFWLGNG